MKFRFADVVNGGQAKATAIINNEVVDLFMIKTLEATMEKEKEDGYILGYRGKQHKASGWNGSGTMSIYYVTSRFRRLLKDFKDTGKDTYFTITIISEDQTSTVGKQVTTLFYCNIDSGIIAKIDVESAALEEDVAFTFEDWDMPEEFTEPVTV